jgi:hypothetical protein
MPRPEGSIMRTRATTALICAIGVTLTGLMTWLMPAARALPPIRVVHLASGTCYGIYAGQLTPGDPVTVCT